MILGSYAQGRLGDEAGMHFLCIAVFSAYWVHFLCVHVLCLVFTECRSWAERRTPFLLQR